MTSPNLRKELEALIDTPWLKDRHPFTKMNPRPLKPGQVLRSSASRAARLIQPSVVYQPTPNKTQQLMARDGNCCWLCHEPLGVDITLEHLVATAHGGPNHMSNYVLCHAACNGALGAHDVATKVRMREARRP